MQEWITLIQVAGPYVLGLGGIAGTYWGVRYQSKSAAEAEARRWQFEAASELLGMAYQVKSLAEDWAEHDQIGASARTGKVHKTPDEQIDSAYSLAAASMVAGDRSVAVAARKLAQAIETQYWSFGVNQTGGLDDALREAIEAFERVCSVAPGPLWSKVFRKKI